MGVSALEFGKGESVWGQQNSDSVFASERYRLSPIAYPLVRSMSFELADRVADRVLQLLERTIESELP